MILFPLCLTHLLDNMCVKLHRIIGFAFGVIVKKSEEYHGLENIAISFILGYIIETSELPDM